MHQLNYTSDEVLQIILYIYESGVENAPVGVKSSKRGKVKLGDGGYGGGASLPFRTFSLNLTTCTGVDT